jgi:hypothetical protein
MMAISWALSAFAHSYPVAVKMLAYAARRWRLHYAGFFEIEIHD